MEGCVRKLSKSFIPLSFLVLVAFSLLSCSGASSPPASLPAPVSQLISIGNPDEIGLVSVLGTSGSVLPNAVVRAQNISQITVVNRWYDFLVSVAWAQVGDPVVSVEANNEGAFEIGLKANIGDSIFIMQVFNGEQSPNVDLKVNGNVVRLPVLPRGLTQPELGLLAVTASNIQSPNGHLFNLDYNETLSPLSFPESAQDFNSCPGLNGLVLDAQDGLGSLLCKDNETLVNFSPDGDLMAQFQEINGVRFIGGRPERDQGVLGIAKIDTSVVTFNTATGSLQCDFLLPHPQGKAKHVQTTRAQWLDLEPFNETSIIVALSQYDDGSWVLTRFQPIGCTEFTILDQVELSDGLEPYDMAAFSFGEMALISVPNSNRILLIDLVSGIATSMPVGKSPLGVAVSQDETTGYVVNSDDSSVSLLDLFSGETLDIPGLGIFPTQIVLLESQGVGTVLSPEDRSIVSFSLEL